LESVIRERLQAHWRDVLVLLEEIARTARLHEGLRLAKAVGHLGRVQVLLAQELDGLPGESESEPASLAGGPPDQDDTPAEGIRLERKGSGP
jgi:hypothetical protein